MRELIHEIEWKNHLVSLLQLGFAVILLSAAIFYYFEQSSSLKTARSNYEVQQFSNDEARSFELILKEYLNSYRSLASQGRIGEPQRLKWIETLRRLGNEYQIAGLQFTLESGELIQENMDQFWHPMVSTRAANMKLTVQMSHEGDLYKLLDGLQREAEGLFTIENCNLTWLEDVSDEIKLSRLRGECELRWYTVVDVTETWETAL